MPIFARRRLRAMLDDLSAHIDSAKAKDLLSRLEHRDTDLALAAEAELSMLWAISRVAQLTVEPDLSGSPRRPDAFSDDLFKSAGAVIEVRALSDHSFSGKQAMDRTANIIANFADQRRKGAGQHLRFEFMERSYWTKRFHRERCVDPDFELTPCIKRHLREWITPTNWPKPNHIRITEGKTNVVVSWVERTSLHFRVFCTMPSVAYDLEDNPIYKALKKKARQVKGAKTGTLRCVFLVDAGCHLLRWLGTSSAPCEIGGEAIISHALQKLSIDAICVFSPHRGSPLSHPSLSHLLWKVSCFDRRAGVPNGEHDQLKALAARLPRPRFEGYQARDIHRQDGFNPKRRGWYLGTNITTRQAGKMTIKISSRLIQEYLAGRMDATAFQNHAFNNDRNLFEAELKRGRTIQGVCLESGGLDEDDDHIVFDLDFDWSATPLDSPKK